MSTAENQIDTGKQLVLSPQARAAQALATLPQDDALRELVKRTQHITGITNNAGYKQADSGRIALKKVRVAITNRAEEVREDAVAFQRSVIAIQKARVAITEPEEKRLQGLQDAYDDEQERIAAAERQAEAARKQAIEDHISAIRDAAARVAGLPSAQIAVAVSELEALEIGEAFGGERERASLAKDATLARLRNLHVKQVEHEAEQERLRLEREEMARQRAEREAKEAADRARRERLNSAVMSIRNIAFHLESASSAAIREAISAMKADPPLESAWGEDLPVMQQANADTLASLDRMLGAAERREEEELARKEYEAELARERAEIATARAAQEAYAGRLSEISAIRHQAIIAAVGRLGVRAGGTSQCARETLAETEAWEVTEEKFGPVLLAVAQAAKHETLEQIRSILMAREVHEEEEARLAAEQAELASQREQLAAQQRQAGESRIAREIEARRLETEAQLKREKEERAAALDSAASEELADESEAARQRNLAEFESVYREAHPTRMPPIVVDLTGASEMPSDEVELTDAAAQMSTQAPIVRIPTFRPSPQTILRLIALTYSVDEPVALEWLLETACELGSKQSSAA